jgi:hypothetical protein
MNAKNKGGSVVLDGMRLSSRVITPDEARAILAMRNTFNRRPKKLLVERMAKDMANGHWLPGTAEFIKFDNEEHLIDGQNRLLAIIQCGQPQKLYVAQELDTDVRKHIDQGKARSAADVLLFHANPQCDRGILAAMLRALDAWETGWLTSAGQKTSRYNISPSDICAVYDAHTDAVESVNWSGSVPAYVRTIPRSARAFTHYVTTTVDSAAAERFWRGVVDQQTNGVGDPRLAMMEFFSKVDQAALTARRTGHRPDRAAASKVTGIYAYGVFEAWNLWRRGKTCKGITHTVRRTEAGETLWYYRDIPTPV